MKVVQPPSQQSSAPSQASRSARALPQPIKVQSPCLAEANAVISVVSNSKLLREALVSLLKKKQTVQFVGSYASEVAVTPLLPNPTNHVVLLDSGIGQEATIAHIQQWRTLEPLPSIVVLELPDDSEVILAYIEAGAHGYVLQGGSIAEVSGMIQQVRRGTAQCSPEVTAKLFDRLVQLRRAQPLLTKTILTVRELEVLRCIARGCRDREIASELVVEVRTVKHHVHNLLQKLNAKHRWEAVQLAAEKGCIDQEHPTNVL